MGIRAKGARVWLLLCATGCGGGGAGDTSGSAGTTGDLKVVATEPADGAVQVARDGEIRITFDAALAGPAVRDDHFWLGSDAEATIEGQLRTEDGGRTVVFTPDVPLAAAMDHTFSILGEVCDQSGRLLPQTQSFVFRTYDAEPPRVAASSVSNGATGVDRTQSLVVGFDERLDPSSVHAGSVLLRDAFAVAVPCALRLAGTQLTIDPIPDLAGDRSYTLDLVAGAGGLTDRAGNPLATAWRCGFRTAPDTTPPTLRWSVPDNGAIDRAPVVRPAFTFDESMDPASFELGGITFRDEFNNRVLFTVSASPDQKTLRLTPGAPLALDRLHYVSFQAGPGGVTDISGNSLAATTVVSFRTGHDATPPTVVSLFPAVDATGVSPNFVARVRFTEPMDPASLDRDTVTLTGPAGTVYATPAVSGDGYTLTVTPAAPAATFARHTLTVRGGLEGVRDAAGNPLAADVTCTFTTNSDATLPTAVIWPIHGALSVPTNARVVAVFTPALDPASVSDDALVVYNQRTASRVAGHVLLERGNRALVFAPSGGVLPASAVLDATLVGGPDGVHASNGNWLSDDLHVRFTTGTHSDGSPPIVTVRLNEIDANRSADLVLPPSGFTLEVAAFDSSDGTEDFATLDVQITGGAGGNPPSSDDFFRLATVSSARATLVFPASLALVPGSYTVRATLRDLSGNLGASAPIAFTVAPPSADVVPFERTQVVWVRFDLDRNGNGVSDLREDLRDYGILSRQDPLGRNAWLERTVIEAVLAQANRLFARRSDGGPVPGSSVSIRLLANQPCHPTHMRIAFGGKDPSGAGNRGYGDQSTGVLGRALFDYRNAGFVDDDTATNPALGVFPDEMFLYEGKIFRDLYPYYLTTFGRTFRVVAPQMGGTPAGEHALDSTVLAAGFVYANATPEQRLRHDQVFGAIDDLATVMGTILAHEIGHGLGLTAAGPPPHGLHGDSSLHDDGADPGDVMSAYVSWDTLVAVEQKFRDIDLAYLRQRVLVK